MRQYGIEAKYWLKVKNEILATMPPQILSYRKNMPEGIFRVQYCAIEFSHNPQSDISNVGQMLSTADMAVRRELALLGYNETGLKHIHFNVELTENEAEKVLGYMKKFTTVKIFFPPTESFQKIRDLNERTAISMGNDNYPRADNMMIRRGENICFHTWFTKFTIEGLEDFYKNLDTLLKSL
ncbi:MAG: hypothetical protein QG670_1129 [Thermoproteota archaeon]|nr:hypothetical protein [Thermoproteota archaeon]